MVARHRWSSRLAFGLTASFLLQVGSVQGATSCKSSIPTGTYAVVVCLVDPQPSETILGEYLIRATAEVDVVDIRVRRLVFYLDGTYLLIDYEAPYEFVLPTGAWPDGIHSLGIEAIMQDDAVTPRMDIPFTVANGNATQSPRPEPFVPRTPTRQVGRPFVVAAAGDGASGERNSADVTDAIVEWDPDLFLYLGDVYEKGTPTEFLNWYGKDDAFYGRLASITNPTIGDHEYENGRADGYFDYWGGIPDYYSYDAAGWHFISLNSTGQFGQTDPGSPQYEWLRADLSANVAPCTFAYFQHPPFSIGSQGGAERMRSIWTLLVQSGVDIVLTANDHNYQRWSPLNEAGEGASSGPTLFVLGTGGHGVRGFERADPRVVVGADSNPEALGALRIQIGPGGAAYEFVNTARDVVDSGSLACTGAGFDSGPPAAPAEISVERIEGGHVAVTWSASDDDIVVTGYQVLRDGEVVAETSSFVPTYTDTDAGTERHEYGVIARDFAGASSLPAIATLAAAAEEATPPPAAETAAESNPKPGLPRDSSLPIGLVAGVLALVALGTAGLMLAVSRLRR